MLTYDYELNDNITIEQLKEAGFREVESGGRRWLTYFKVLYEDIELYINFDITNSEVITFSENKNVEVIDDVCGQYFMPFYRGINNVYVRTCQKRYQEEMNVLVNKGILKLRDKNKQLIKTK